MEKFNPENIPKISNLSGNQFVGNAEELKKRFDSYSDNLVEFINKLVEDLNSIDRRDIAEYVTKRLSVYALSSDIPQTPENYMHKVHEIDEEKNLPENYPSVSAVVKYVNSKEDKTVIENDDSIGYDFWMENHNNRIIRLTNKELVSIHFYFTENIPEDYMSCISFFSNNDVVIIYDIDIKGKIEWIGSDCIKENGLTEFYPQNGKAYDVIFAYNGNDILGYVSGYVPSGGNVNGI